MKVPYSGISNQLGLAEMEMVLKAMQQDTLSRGSMNAEFERQFAAYLGATHVQATSSCTSALYLAAQALGLQEGDEVITTPQTFWVTTWPLQARKCQIRFADIEANSLNIDPTKVEALVTERTKSIWIVHHGGQAVDMEPIMEIARRYNLTVVEDCAHAPGATYKGQKVGTIGDIGCFSFHSLKNMTTGEGGAFVTNNDLYAEKARHLGTIHVWGQMQERVDKTIGPHAKPDYYEDWHVRFSFEKEYVGNAYEVGHNYRLNEISAALGIAQLQKLDQLNERRRYIASRLDEGLTNVPGISLQIEKSYAYHIYHLYTIFYHPEIVGAPKDDFIRYLEQEEGIAIVIRYFPIHLLSEFRAMGYTYGLCPVAEKTYFEHQIQLPIYAHLTEAQIDHMVAAVRRVVKRLGTVFKGQ
jgi:dTDP-4-amino-4,6-dideoxygalactose transaminase